MFGLTGGRGQLPDSDVADLRDAGPRSRAASERLGFFGFKQHGAHRAAGTPGERGIASEDRRLDLVKTQHREIRVEIKRPAEGGTHHDRLLRQAVARGERSVGIGLLVALHQENAQMR